MNVSADSLSTTNSYLICNNCQKVIRKKEKGMKVPRPLSSGPSSFIPENEIVEATPVDSHTILLLAEELLHERARGPPDPGDGPSPALPGVLPEESILPAADGRAPPPALPPLHRHHGSCSAPVLVLGKDARSGVFTQMGVPWLITKEHIQKLVKTGGETAVASTRKPDGGNANSFQQMGVSNVCSCDLANDNSLDEVPFSSPALGTADSVSELEALMERMKRLLEEREDEEASQEEMATRFEKEKKESPPSGYLERHWSGTSARGSPPAPVHTPPLLSAGVLPAAARRDCENCANLFISVPAAVRRARWAGFQDESDANIESVSVCGGCPPLATRTLQGMGRTTRQPSEHRTTRGKTTAFRWSTGCTRTSAHLLDEKFRTVYNLTYYNMATHRGRRHHHAAPGSV
ncbi:hypothetical protein SKAU_G00080040 [Synaphobranchus kaupii]|uniref:Uncharacterized protein n=1 Tax=Synaphobranchus kaupii TaxID=118154 RepID=A0A9Q1FUN3_SYNKA|nr:hypothetical protein SKAU_G00080040 [Synaphobranchus kaupii]